MRIPNRELAVLAPAIAKESRDYPSPAADAALERLLAAAVRRELPEIVRTVRAILEPRAILETPAGPEGPAVSPDTAEL